MNRFIVLFLMVLTSSTGVFAQFVDCYAEANWTIDATNTGPNTLEPGVVFDNNISTMTLTADGDFMGVSGSMNPAGIPFDCSFDDGIVKACITIPSSGTISFSWFYTMPIFLEDPANEPFGYCLNANNFVSLITPGLFITQNGVANIEVESGDELCIVMASYFSEEFQAVATVFNFSGTECVAAPPMVELSVASEILCNGDETGAIGIDVTGGTEPYMISWENGIDPENVPAGEYCVTVTDSELIEVVECITISEPDEITIDVQISGEIGCFGGFVSATAIPSGGTGDYMVNWSNGEVGDTATELTSGENDVSVTDSNGCLEIATFMITAPEELTVFISMVAETNMDMNGTATATGNGGTPPYAYAWDTEPAQTTETATNMASGDYNVTVTDANGCEVTGSIFVDNMVGTLDFENLVELELFPNPSNGQVSVILELERAQDFAIELFNNFGQKVSRTNFNNTKTVNQIFDWTDLPKGLYWISLISDKEQLSQKLILK